MSGENKMREIKLDKVVLHICAGEYGPKLENAKEILKRLTNGRKPADTKAKVKLPKWGLRPGLPIGAKVTLRGKDAEEFLKKALKAKDNKLSVRNFDSNGNFAFGIKEYIEIEGMKYDPDLGIYGFDVLVNLKRPGFRIKYRKLKRKKIKKAAITKEEAINFVKEKFGVLVE